MFSLLPEATKWGHLNTILRVGSVKSTKLLGVNTTLTEPGNIPKAVSCNTGKIINISTCWRSLLRLTLAST